MLAHNVRVGRSEIDLIVDDHGVLAIVEVKTRRVGDPATRFDDDKVRALRRAVARMRPRPRRIDLVTVELGHGAATITWHRNAG